IRLRARSLYTLPLLHLYSEWDPAADQGDLPGRAEEAPTARPLRCGQALPELWGYSEWAGASDPLVSVGWDWRVRWGPGTLAWDAGELRTNLMLVDERGQDLGVAPTQLLLQRRLMAMGWERTVASALGLVA
ncbi:MAG TPA: DUF4902 domain-containing protein, partial [Burkholderiaceae bacterium]|nr:DUF4902 domain-containing protein [Burkholderiaceae bacterium]